MDIPPNIKVEVPSAQRIILSGMDLQKLGIYAAKIRAWRKPEPYNLKGVFVNGETIKKKQGKKR